MSKKEEEIKALRKTLEESKVLHAQTIKIFLMDVDIETGETNVPIAQIVTFWKNLNSFLESFLSRPPNNQDSNNSNNEIG